MLIIGNDNETIEIKIIDYEFPKIQHFEDGNWLQIYFKIKNRLGQ